MLPARDSLESDRLVTIQNDQDIWEDWWDARIIALESVLGASDSTVLHAPVPLFMGADIGGAADVVTFSHHLESIVYVTSDLIGSDDQVPNRLGNYELMICHRDPSEWGPNLISRLAAYTLETALEPGETMDIGSATPPNSTISAFMFLPYAALKVKERDCGLLLCLGITPEELAVCRSRGSAVIEQQLKNVGVYPFTDLERASVI